jgi:digeranylgeranylglycerophospholipid reductase
MNSGTFDVVVIGGGPAGARTGALVAGAGCRVLLLEKRERIGYPVRCAEAVGPREDVERYLTLDETLVSSPVNGFLVVSPGGRRFEKRMPGIGFVVDRELFDRRLVEAAERAGAVVRTGHQAMGLIRENGRIAGVRAQRLDSGEAYEVRCSVVVGADGVESHSPRWAGLKKAFRPEELFSCAQELIGGMPDVKDFIEFHLGERFAPGGYAWVFPKGDGRANVGVGINPARAGGRTALQYLNEFISHRCPRGERLRLVIGGCAVARGIRSLTTEGFVVVGEAAHQNNPFSGGGIINALEGADMAGAAIINALGRGDSSGRALTGYTKRWNRTVGRTNEAFWHAARLFFTLPDDEMERVMNGATRVPGIFYEKGVRPVRMILSMIMANPGFSLRLLGSLIRGRRR